jgi:translation initiation factor IF-2
MPVAEAPEQPMAAAAGEEPHRPRRSAALPPGVVARGNAVAESVGPQLSEAQRQRIVQQHAARQPLRPRRKELGRAALGPTGRQAGRPGGRVGRKKMAPGKKGKQTEITVPSAQKRVIRIEEQIQLQTLAQRMSLKATDVLMKLMQLGMGQVHINSTLDADTAKILANEFGYEVENVARSAEEIIGDARGEFADQQTDWERRPPVVTIMGHVDHGKTSLLDRIRKANVASGEAGGITQHIGAYRVEHETGTLVFLDTPGHEAFTAMRARGGQVADLVVLVVAADDGVMPQTKEAINHARAAEVPIVVAVNKIDKHDARPDQVKNELASEGLQPEEWGGDTIFVPCSAITGDGIDKLLEAINLTSELLELQANPTIPAEGAVLEAYLDRGRGPVANVLVRNGTLNTGDYVVAGGVWGRVRALTDDRGKQLKKAGPATPVEVLGLSDMPAAGDRIYVVTDQKRAVEVADAQKTEGPAVRPQAAPRGLDQIYQMMQSGEVEELKLVVKADVQGSVEAIVKALTDLSTERVKVNVIHTGVGGITENDVMLASASDAIIIGFNVRPAGQAGATAKKEGVDVRQYNVIYEAVDEVKQAMTGLLAPKLVEKALGKAEVRQTFGIPKIGTVAGCYVTEGKIVRGAKVRLVRDAVQVWDGKVGGLRRIKEDVREVAAGKECGISLEGYNDVKIGDVIECFEVEEVAPSIEEL